MFISFGIKDFIDIFLVALLLFYCFKLMKNTRSMYLFVGVLSFVILWLVVSQLLNMRLLGSIMDGIVSVGAIALIVLFQDDIRKFFFSLGSDRRMKGFLKHLNKTDEKTRSREEIVPIVMACLSMSRQKVGALIVIQKGHLLSDYIRSGETVDAHISQRLIENIFFKNSPLHDGAMIIGGNRIVAAGCVLPVSHNMNMPKELGLRHRAAMGIGEETDALIIVVSEETGFISVVRRGEIKVNISAEELEHYMIEE